MFISLTTCTVSSWAELMKLSSSSSFTSWLALVRPLPSLPSFLVRPVRTLSRALSIRSIMSLASESVKSSSVGSLLALNDNTPELDTQFKMNEKQTNSHLLFCLSLIIKSSSDVETTGTESSVGRSLISEVLQSLREAKMSPTPPKSGEIKNCDIT